MWNASSEIISIEGASYLKQISGPYVSYKTQSQFTSTLQIAEHPSPFNKFPSSQNSYGCFKPSPQTAGISKHLDPLL